LLLLDDLAARSLADSSGLTFTGTLGCLVEAKSRGLVEKVAPLLDQLRSAARFWISEKLKALILRDVGEAK
jgi:predicted nucleic acid-binding protein